MSLRVLLFSAAASLVLTACGPSLRRSHRASAYFEECYAADLDRAVPDADRRACWQAWSRSYQVGASAERLDYVRERLAMLDPARADAISLATGDDGSVEHLDTPDENGDMPSPDPSPDPSAPPTDSTELLAESSPSVVAVPVQVSEPAVAPIRTPTPSEVAPPDLSAANAATDARHARTHERHLHRDIVAPSTSTSRCPCESGWRTCSATCLADDYGCIAACRREFTLCSRSCY